MWNVIFFVDEVEKTLLFVLHISQLHFGKDLEYYILYHQLVSCKWKDNNDLK